MEPFKNLTSGVVVLPINNIDTDQIIPARFLKVTDKAGLGANLFADWRYLPDGSPNPEFELNLPENQGANILLAGHNFGCGSSREHAPWALKGFGFRAVIACGFADIFRNNSLKNGLLPVDLSPEHHQQLIKLLSAAPESTLSIDISTRSLVFPDGQVVHFPLDEFSRTCLINGVDELGYILGMADEISAYEKRMETV